MIPKGATLPISVQTSAVWRVRLHFTVALKVPFGQLSARWPGLCILQLATFVIWSTAGFYFWPTAVPSLR